MTNKRLTFNIKEKKDYKSLCTIPDPSKINTRLKAIKNKYITMHQCYQFKKLTKLNNTCLEWIKPGIHIYMLQKILINQ
uniref:Uncharacterized protein n=1 Tax=Kalanchoe fedtschenkoi TaxID=63787 RepID=A0A7N0RBM5_KALFE